MRQLNFLLFFALCLALASFSIENPQNAPINVIPGVQLEAPLSIELLLAVGTGAMLAWVFSLWDQLQRQIESWKAQRELQQKSRKIEELEKTISELQTSEEMPIKVLETKEPVVNSLPAAALSEATVLETVMDVSTIAKETD